MRLKDYGRNQKKRKEYIQQNGLLLVGVDLTPFFRYSSLSTTSPKAPRNPKRLKRPPGPPQ